MGRGSDLILELFTHLLGGASPAHKSTVLPISYLPESNEVYKAAGETILPLLKMSHGSRGNFSVFCFLLELFIENRG